MAKYNIKRRHSKTLDLSLGKRYKPLSKNIFDIGGLSLPKVNSTLNGGIFTMTPEQATAAGFTPANNSLAGMAQTGTGTGGGKGFNMSGFMDKAGSVVSGITSIVDSSMKNAQIADTSGIESDIKNLQEESFSEATDSNSLLDAYNNINFQKDDYTMKDVRGASGGELAMNTLSAVGSGAAAGASVGGPWGAVAGAAVGLGGALTGLFVGNKKAREKAELLNLAAKNANKVVVDNFDYQAGSVIQDNARNAMKSAYAKDGGAIHIKKKNRGKFTASAKRAGMGVQEYARHVLANKDRYSSTLVKRANFARNAAGWKHALGGHKYDGEGDIQTQIGTLSPVDGWPGVYQGTAHSGFLDNWNAARLATGRFDSQLGNGIAERQSNQRDSTPLYYLPYEFSLDNGLNTDNATLGLYAPEGANLGMLRYLNSDSSTFLRDLSEVDAGRETLPFGRSVVLSSAVDDTSHALYDRTLGTHEDAHASLAEEQEAAINSARGRMMDRRNAALLSTGDVGSGQLRSSNPYLDSSKEIYARLMQLRQAYGIDPTKEFDTDTLNVMKIMSSKGGDSKTVKQREKYFKEFNKDKEKFRSKYGFTPGATNQYDILNRYDDEMLLDLFNKVASSAPQSNQERGLYSSALTNFAAMGGKINTGTHGGDFSNGVTLINNGGTHEQNPYEGVPIGIAPDGQPNLVEEGEVIYNDYVFSNRLHPTDKEIKESKLPKKYKGYTFALIAEDMSKESAERPNDPISKRGLEDSLGKLAMIQEQQRMRKGKRGTQQMMAFGGRKYAGNLDLDPVVVTDKKREMPSIIDKNAYANLINMIQDDRRIRSFLDSVPEMESEENINALDAAFQREALAGLTYPSVSPSTATTKAAKPASTSSKSAKPLSTSSRYAPVIGSAIGALQSVFQKPDYTNSDLILNAVDNLSRARVSPRLINNYLNYKPLDRNYYLNQLQGQAGATRRAIMNSGSNPGQVMAGLLAADYNAQQGVADTLMKMDMYNEQQRQAIEQFNRGTDQYNSGAGMNADAQNAQLAQNRDRMRLSGITTAAGMREAADTALANSKSMNYTNFFDNLGAIGQENFVMNQIQSNPSLYYHYTRPGNGTISYGAKRGRMLTKRNRRRR